MSDTTTTTAEAAAGAGEQQSNGQASADGQSTKDASTVDAGRTYSQADFDRILQGRLSKFSDYDQIKSELDDLKASNASDSEKAVQAAKNEGRAEAFTQLSQRLIQAEARAVAASAGFHDPQDAYRFIDSDDLVSKDGEVDSAALESAITKLAEDKPHLVKSEDSGMSAGDAGIGVTGGDPDPGPGTARLAAAYSKK